MINFESALERRKDVLKKFLNDEMRFAADFGCGSGLDSISLSKLGLKVTAFDLSKEMIEKAKQNSKKTNTEIEFHQSSLDKIASSKFKNKFDFAVSLGNTLANLDLKKLETAFQKISSMMKSNGKLLVQILNYSAVLKNDERIINIGKSGDEYFVRFYDFYSEHLNFNIIKFNKDKTSEREFFTTKLFPHDKNIFEKILKANGFGKIQFFGSLNSEKFNKNESKDLIIFAVKSN